MDYGGSMKKQRSIFNNRLSEKWIYPKMWSQKELIQIKMDNDIFNNKYNDSHLPVRLYIHTPFCVSFCCFCPYYKEPYNKMSDEDKDAFYGALVKEIIMYSKQPYFTQHKIGTIYFGGGDPGLIESKYLSLILKTIFDNFKLSSLTQITMEGSVLAIIKNNNWNIYKEYAVNRLSYGVQTFSENLRNKLHLKPTLSDIDNLVNLIKKNGIPDHSIDLMYNIPDQSLDDVVNDVERAIDLDATYVDDYSMNLFPNTMFKKVVDEGDYFNEKPNNEKMIQMFEKIMETFEKNDYNQVASMIFSRKCTKPHDGLVHFLKGYPMVGVGPSARGYINKFNYRNVCDVKKYVQSLNCNIFPIEVGNIISTFNANDRAYVFFPILMNISREEIVNYEEHKEELNFLVSQDYAYWDGNILRLTRKGIIWAGNIQYYISSDDEIKRDTQGFLKAILENKNPYNQDKMGVKKC